MLVESMNQQELKNLKSDFFPFDSASLSVSLLRLRFLLSLIFIFILSCEVCSQDVRLTGRVFDKASSQPLYLVSVFDSIASAGTRTDKTGFFELSVTRGEHKLKFTYIGYQRIDTTIKVSGLTEISAFMSPLTIPIDEVIISSRSLKDQVSSPEMSSLTFKNIEIMKLPSILGETDPMKILQLTPGVQGGSEGNSGFYVRGGGADQNMILFNNTLVYNPAHLLGIFSVFNPDQIKDVTIIKSGIPARYGGKLSSVIKVNSSNGNKDSLEVKGSIGMISSRVSVGGPLFNGKGTFIAGARRTYLELLVQPLVRKMVKDFSFFNNETRYNFHDFNLGVSVSLTSRDIFSLSGYYGRDVFNMKRSGIDQKNSVRWGNFLTSLSWNHFISESNQWNLDISRTKYEFGLDGSQGEYSFGLLSSVEDYTLKYNYSSNILRHHINYGFDLTNHKFIPNKIDAQSGSFNVNFIQFSSMNAFEGGIYLDDEFMQSEHFSLSGGLRYSFYDHYGPYKDYIRDAAGQITDTIKYPKGESLTFYHNLEPRVVMKYQINKNNSVKASYMRISQYIHLATSASVSLPADIWIPSTGNIKPQTGNQISIGYFSNLSKRNLEFSSEIYYKRMNNQLEFLKGIIYSSFDASIGQNIALGFGQSYGIEFYLNKPVGKSTGWISYALSRTENKFDEINEGYIYPAKYDRRHELSVVFLQKITSKWSGSAVFTYISGSAFTMPIGRYIIQGNMVNEYGDVNSFRMPPYHRLDLSFSRKVTFHNDLTSELIFSVFNVYCRANPYFIYFETNGDIDNYSLEVKPIQVSLLPIIPSISWNFKF